MLYWVCSCSPPQGMGFALPAVSGGSSLRLLAQPQHMAAQAGHNFAVSEFPGHGGSQMSPAEICFLGFVSLAHPSHMSAQEAWFWSLSASAVVLLRSHGPGWVTMSKACAIVLQLLWQSEITPVGSKMLSRWSML